MSSMGRCALVVALAVPLLILGCDRDRTPQAQPATAQAQLVVEGLNPQMTFEQYYRPVPVTVQASIPGYDLPLDLGQIVNADKVQWMLTEPVREMLQRQGFAVIDRGNEEDIKAIYELADDRDIPPFVTVDTLLHIYHLQFDQTLKSIEEREFYGSMTEFSRAMLSIAQAQQAAFDGDLQEAAKRNVAYFAVGLKCLDPSAQVPADVADLVSAELALIDAHAGFSASPVFGYDEDYSQYVPRGHYTRGIKLERYFRAMMWLGRMAFLLKGNNETITDALVDEAMADRQTIQALLISRDLTGDEALLERWQRLYSVTSFFVGLSDDLTIFDYAEAYPAARATAGTKDVAAKAFLNGVRWRMARKRSPLIYGGTGAQMVSELDETEATLAKVLEATKGLRVMGQRFVPDSYVLGRLVDLPYTGAGEPFTMARGPLGPSRGFPRGLDVMQLLGSARAQAVLEAEGDTDYKGYADRVAKLAAIFGSLDRGDWHQNLYWSWLASLRTLLAPFGAGYPSFMQTEAYTDKGLYAALASWAQLRHDTILYAKQSYGMVGAGPPPPPKAEPPGFVEPVPGLYAELVALNAMSHKGLEALGVLSEEMGRRFTSADRILRRLLALSLKELQGEALTEAELKFIKEFGGALDGALGALTDDSKRTTIVADVHTNIDMRLVLEEATGPVDLMWVVWKTPGGEVVAGAGPVFSHYEFKHPMADRLTDEKWRELVKGEAPEQAPWTGDFRAAEK